MCSSVWTNVDETGIASLSIFPNPSSGTFKITLEQSIIKESLKLFDILGKEISLNVSTNNQETVLLEVVPKVNGMFFLEGKTINGNYFKKKIILN